VKMLLVPGHLVSTVQTWVTVWILELNLVVINQESRAVNDSVALVGGGLSQLRLMFDLQATSSATGATVLRSPTTPTHMSAATHSGVNPASAQSASLLSCPFCICPCRLAWTHQTSRPPPPSCVLPTHMCCCVDRE
jgi:hypothetical protein